MVLQTESEVRLLPPVLPALLPRRTTQNYTFRPVALDNSASGSASKSSSSGSSGSSSKDSASTNDINISIPSVSFPFVGKYGLGMGIGGAAYFSGISKAVALWPFHKPQKGTKSDKKQVLIAFSNTGGGHLASSEALRQAFHDKFGDKYEISIEDLWEKYTPAPWPSMPPSYAYMVKYPILWKIAYHSFQPKWIHQPYMRFFHACAGNLLNTAMDKFDPDLLISVHPLMQHVLIQMLQKRIRLGWGRPMNFAAVVTDFTTCHNCWFHEDSTRTFVPTPFCADLARKNGLKEEQIILHGLPIRPIFAKFAKKMPPRNVLKAKLGLDTDLPAVLLIGGGEGMGRLEDMVDEMAKTLTNQVQVVVVCGRNKDLLNKLKAKNYATGLPVIPFGFLDNIHELMGACDAIVTKAGPGTIAEALIAGLPILLNGNVPCQEVGNIPWVLDNKVGDFNTDPVQIAKILAHWMLGPEGYEMRCQMGQRSKALSRPDAVYRIVEDLAKLADAPDFQFGPAKEYLKFQGNLGTNVPQLAPA